jgi:hypothetical protein
MPMVRPNCFLLEHWPRHNVKEDPLNTGASLNRAEDCGLSEGLTGLLSGFSRASFFFFLGRHPECCPPSLSGLELLLGVEKYAGGLWALEGTVEGPWKASHGVS